MQSQKLIPFLVVVFLLIVSTLPSPPVEATEDSWTVIIFMAGDNNLGGNDQTTEGTQVDSDIGEIVASNSPVDVIVVGDEYGASNTEVWHIQSGVQTQKYITGVTPEANMGSTLTYERTIDYVYANYPNEHYAIIFWNHGLGWGGVCEEWVDPVDKLINLEIRSILSHAKDTINQDVDVVGFDACYMNQMDIAYDCKDYADIFIASEDSEDWFGWYYQFLAEVDEDTSPEHFGELVCWYYQDYYTNIRIRPYTMMAMNLTLFDLNVTEHFSQFFQNLKYESLTERSNILSSLDATTKFLQSGAFEFYDLHDFADEFQTRSSNTTLDTLASNLKASLLNATIAFNSSYSQSKGLGFYMATGASGSTSTSTSGYWEGYSSYNICRFTQFDEFQHQLFSQVDRTPNIPDAPTVTVSGSTITIEGAGVQYKLGKGPWLSSTTSQSLTNADLYYRGWNGADYSEQQQTTVTGNTIVAEGGYVTSITNLESGWNIFAPFAQSSQGFTASSLCKDVGLDDTMIYTRNDDGSYNYYIQGGTRQSFPLTLGKAYYVFTSDDAELVSNGDTESRQTLFLNPGWNFIGITANTLLLASDFTSNANITQVIERNIETTTRTQEQGTYNTYFPDTRQGTDFDIGISEGVYVYSTASTEFIIGG